MRAAVDVMGGDRAPDAILAGCFEAAELLSGDDLVYLVGDEAVSTAALNRASIKPELKKHFKVIPTTQVIGMDEPPVEAIRNKSDSSISVMCKMAARGEADVVISAGNTGACVAASQLRMRTLPGVSRPGIAVVLPTFHGPVVICDVGANISPKPKHLQQYALMAAAYGEAVCGLENPRVGLLSIGEEDAKGTTMVKDSRKLMRDEPLINFIGNVEGRDLFKGSVDVVVCDGFVGNIMIKSWESLVRFFSTMLKEELQANAVRATGALLSKGAFNALKERINPERYGGAPLLGLNGNIFKAHGSSNRRAIKSAIVAANEMVKADMNLHIEADIARANALFSQPVVG